MSIIEWECRCEIACAAIWFYFKRAVLYKRAERSKDGRERQNWISIHYELTHGATFDAIIH